MKNFIKRFTAVIAAVLIFCISVVPSSVSASCIDIVKRSSGISDTLIDTYTDKFYNNQSVIDLGYTVSNSILFMCHYSSYSGAKIFCCKTSELINEYDCARWYNNGFNLIYPWFSSSSSIQAEISSSELSNLDTFNFSETVSDIFSGSSFTCVAESDGFLYYSFAYSTSDSRNPTGFGISTTIPYTCSWYFLSPEQFIGPSLPDSSDKLTFTGVRLGVDKKGFLEWIITEGKESVINSSGYSFTQKQLSLLVDVFDSYGNSLFWFHSSLIKTFALTQHSLKGTSALLSTLQELYRDYLDYKNSIEIVEITPDDSAKPHWRQDKNDNTLFIDQEDDTTILSLLREILRTLIYLPSSIRTSFSDLATNIVSIIYNWNRLFDLLNNLEFPSVEIPDNSSLLEYLFKPTFSDFDNLESEVKEKFPLLSQIEDLPDPDKEIINSLQPVSSYASVDDQPMLPSFEAEDVYKNDNLFSFEVPEGSTILNGSLNGIKVPFASFSKLLPAIEAFKGIISVIAVSAFSKWLIQFAPKLMHGYSSGD